MGKLRNLLLGLAVILLGGCNAPYAPVVVDSAEFSVRLLDKPHDHWPANIVGVTYGECGGLRHIEILKDYYPECLTHEIRHVFECAWHGDIPTNCR